MPTLLDYINSDMLIRTRESSYMDYYTMFPKRVDDLTIEMDTIYFKLLHLYEVCVKINNDIRYFTVTSECDINSKLSEVILGKKERG